MPIACIEHFTAISTFGYNNKHSKVPVDIDTGHWHLCVGLESEINVAKTTSTLGHDTADYVADRFLAQRESVQLWLRITQKLFNVVLIQLEVFLQIDSNHQLGGVGEHLAVRSQSAWLDHRTQLESSNRGKLGNAANSSWAIVVHRAQWVEGGDAQIFE